MRVGTRELLGSFKSRILDASKIREILSRALTCQAHQESAKSRNVRVWTDFTYMEDEDLLWATLDKAESSFEKELRLGQRTELFDGLGYECVGYIVWMDLANARAAPPSLKLLSILAAHLPNLPPNS